MQHRAIPQDLRIQLWAILQHVLEVKIPFFGIPLKGVNNPILVLDAIVKPSNNFIKIDIIDDFLTQFNEAIGFECASEKKQWDASIPFSSYYIYITNEIAEDSIRKCGIPIDEKEKFEILHLIDEALFPQNYLVKALRTAQQLDAQILYREGEEPVEVSLKKIVIKTLSSFPLDQNPRYMDNSLIHLVGILPVEYAESRSVDLIQVENGLWSAIYSLPYLYIKSWKWIWDLNWVTLIEFSSLEEV
ncbi:hypothetical protein V6M85_10140 [Sulfolobus tengchongensis]|uniref:Uncharacterized protein n=1 Tax=Sulfolobus tengchongensis TaxID=207809 RepID=A0AAX4KY90_9CREN